MNKTLLCLYVVIVPWEIVHLFSHEFSDGTQGHVRLFDTNNLLRSMCTF